MTSHSFLALVLLLVGVPEMALAEEAMSEHENLIDFSEADTSKWYVINDGVMGGVSRSDIQRTAEETGVFAGVMSLESNGGFASVRADLGRRNLSAYAGLEIRVRCDGRTY
jgi:monofunctional biosynthetic peptidoglycan transglycosylase